ncbi:MAG: hypothetical protein AAFO62_05780 [Pseudomonadota bacterium]
MSKVSHTTARIVAIAIMAGAIGTTGAVTSQVVTATKAEAVPKRVRRWCKRDYKRLCPRYRAGTSRMRACMRAKRNYLSAICKKALIDAGYAG